MQLKQYQEATLRDLAHYIDVLNESNSLSAAYSRYWASRGVSVGVDAGDTLHPYINNVVSVPRVTLKVPTAGGKTFIACNAIKTIFDRLHTDAPNRVVAWFVPSDTILKQTLEKLQNTQHPYRRRLDALFNHRVTVVDKEAALTGQGISLADLRENLIVFVLSAQSFVETIKAKKDRSSEQSKPRVYRENGNFIEYVNHYADSQNLIEGTDPTALIQVIAWQRPLVIVDESHNFKADLRVEMLNNISPRFILELTATPRENSNIISFVDAMQLKRENMVKLPVIVENRNSANDVLVNAVRMRNSLEQHAEEMRRQGGRYIRPIVLFQAQPKSADDNYTFVRIKQNLIRLGIPDEQIKIKTADKDELKGVDLMSERCAVRYVITVNALKEGWDCPFAYILATLANKTSVVDVEQILGRILRQPYATNHANALLNISYVFTCSNDFRRTVEKIILSLQKAGFSGKDFREAADAANENPEKPSAVPGNLFEWSESTPDNAEEEADIADLTDEEVEAFRQEAQNPQPAGELEDFQKQAAVFSADYDKTIETDLNYDDPLAGIMPMEKYCSIKATFKDVVANVVLPMFHAKTNMSIFTDSEWVLLDKTMLSEGFDLSSKDSSVDFTVIRPQGTIIDVSDSDDNYVPVRKNNQQAMDLIRRQYLDKSATVKKSGLARQIAYMITIDSIPDPVMAEYVAKAIAPLDSDEIDSLLSNIYHAKDTIQSKIDGLLKEYQAKVFYQWLDLSRIKLLPCHTLDEKRIFTGKELLGLGKGLYTKEESVNNFEYDVISTVAGNERVLFWHRNTERKGFCLNGFINHYPDFIICMKSGNIILVETKGDHLANDDSMSKIKIGRKWADLAGEKYHYFMVFENREIDGAITVKQLLQYLNEL